MDAACGERDMDVDSRLALKNISLFGKPQATQSVEGDRTGCRPEG